MIKHRKFDLILVTQTRRLGYAVFNHNELFDIGVKTFSQPRNSETIKSETAAIIQNLIDQFSPELITVKSLAKCQLNSRLQKRVIVGIIKVASKRSIRFEFYDFDVAKLELKSHQTRITNATTFTKLVQEFPELSRFIYLPNYSQTKYYSSMLAAAAIGLARYRSRKQ